MELGVIAIVVVVVIVIEAAAHQMMDKDEFEGRLALREGPFEPLELVPPQSPGPAVFGLGARIPERVKDDEQGVTPPEGIEAVAPRL